MSDLDEMEIDYTRIHKKICSIEELRVLKEKYKDYKIADEIDHQIKEKENENILTDRTLDIIERLKGDTKWT